MIRIQRKRTKGWRMPEGAIYVGRPSRWGNFAKVGDLYHSGFPGHHLYPYREWRVTLDETIALYRAWLTAVVRANPDFLDPLRGHDLVCWCPLDQPCHADVLIEKLTGA